MAIDMQDNVDPPDALEYMQGELTKMRRIASCVPGKVWIQAKEAAGYATHIIPQESIPPVLLGPDSGRVIAEIVASHKLADDIRAAGEADPLEVACDLLREAETWIGRYRGECDCVDCEIQTRVADRILAFLAERGRA